MEIEKSGAQMSDWQAVLFFINFGMLLIFAGVAICYNVFVISFGLSIRCVMMVGRLAGKESR